MKDRVRNEAAGAAPKKVALTKGVGEDAGR